MKKLFSILAGLLITAGALPDARAALTGLGNPVSPHGFPAYYQDATGLRLEPCLPPPAGNATRDDLCVFDPLDPDSAIKVAGEIFWWMGDASMAMPGGGSADLILGIEGTFGGNEAPVDGQQISFGRTRIRIDTPVAGTYTVTHPYGTRVFEVADPAEGINYTADIGAADFRDPAVGFRGTLTSPIGPFLTWPGYAQNTDLQVRQLDELGQPTGAVLEQYVGNPTVASTVVGSPTGNNFFRVQGPDGIDVQTDQFFVMGKVFDPTVPQTVHIFPDVPPRKLFAVGPVNRVDFFATPSVGEVSGEDFDYAVGYPLWYQEMVPVLDANGVPIPDPVTGEPQSMGVKLTLCTPGDAMCISDPIDPTDPVQRTLRTGGEGFWWSADARFDTSAGRAQLVLGLEATFGADESLIDGQQISFGRERIRIDTPAAGTYRVTHPYGQRIFEEVPAGDGGINFTADIGIANPADPDGAFAGALYSDIGPTFLKWTTFNADPALTDPLLVKPNAADTLRNNYYVGDPGLERAITGSPFGTNFFRVERLVGDDWVLVGETNLFAVSGKVYDPATFEFAINAAAPVAVADEASLNLAQASSVTINVLNNDTLDGVAIPNVTPAANVSVATLPPGEAFGPQGGTVTVNPAGTVTYTPGAAFAATGGVDTFAYHVTDNSTGLTSGHAVVTVTVVPRETIAISKARLDLRKLRWDIQGTSNFEGTVLTLRAGSTASGPVVGTATVNDGRWSFRGGVTSNPNVSSITAVSPTGTTVTQPLQVR